MAAVVAGVSDDSLGGGGNRLCNTVPSRQQTVVAGVASDAWRCPPPRSFAARRWRTTQDDTESGAARDDGKKCHSEKAKPFLLSFRGSEAFSLLSFRGGEADEESGRGDTTSLSLSSSLSAEKGTVLSTFLMHVSPPRRSFASGSG